MLSRLDGGPFLERKLEHLLRCGWTDRDCELLAILCDLPRPRGRAIETVGAVWAGKCMDAERPHNENNLLIDNRCARVVDKSAGSDSWPGRERKHKRIKDGLITVEQGGWRSFDRTADMRRLGCKTYRSLFDIH